MRAYVSFRRSSTALQRETRNARETASENDKEEGEENDEEAEEEEEEEKRSEMKENAFAFALAREGRESGAGLIIRRAKEDLSGVRFP